MSLLGLENLLLWKRIGILNEEVINEMVLG